MGPCVAPGCRSNYMGEKFAPTFKFPSNKALREKWIKCVPRKGWTCTKYSTLCIRHFREEDIIDTITFIDADGSLQNIPAGKRSLREGSLPCIWPGVPAHLVTPVAKKLSAIAEKDASRRAKVEAKPANSQHTDSIKDYFYFSAHYNDKLQPQALSKNWCAVSDDTCTAFCMLSIGNIPAVRASVKVDLDLGVSVVVGTVKVSSEQYAWAIPNGKLEKWSELKNLLIHYSSPDQLDLEKRMNLVGNEQLDNTPSTMPQLCIDISSPPDETEEFMTLVIDDSLGHGQQSQGLVVDSAVNQHQDPNELIALVIGAR